MIVDEEGGKVNYKHTVWGTVLLSITLVSGIVALVLADKDATAIVALGGLVVQGLMTLIVSKGVDDVKHQVNGNTTALIAKLPDPEVLEPIAKLAQRQSMAGAAAADATVIIPRIPADDDVVLAQSVLDFQRLYGPKCAVPGCVRPRGHVGEEDH